MRTKSKPLSIPRQRRVPRAPKTQSASWDPAVIDAIPQFFWTCRPDGVVDYVNRFFREHTGMTAQTVHAKWAQAVHPDDLPGVAASWQKALATGTTWEGEYRFRDVSGGYRWYLGRSTPFRDESGAVCRWIGTAADITAQKNVEQKLHELNETLEHRVAERTSAAEQRAVDLARSEKSVRDQADLLRSVLASVADGVCVSDEKGKLILFTPAAERILGMGLFEGNMEEWSRHYGVFQPDGVTPFPVTSLPLARALSGESCADVEMIIRNPGHPQGQWISVTGRPLRDEADRIRGGVVAISDITARKQAQAEINFRQSLLESQAEASVDGILLVDPAGKILLVNTRLLRMWSIPDHIKVGGNDGESLAHACSQVSDPDAFLEKVRWLYDHPDVEDREEIALADGRTFERHTAPMRGADGRLYGRIWFFRDITDRKQAEEHLREMAEHNTRLVKEVDHRVGNNIAGLMGLVTVMQQRAGSVDTFADTMLTRLRAMSQIHHLLRESGWQPVGLRTLICTTLDALANLARESPETRVEGPELLIAPSRVASLIMIVVEWFTNSCKYGVHSAPGGRLLIVWEATDAGSIPARIRLSWTERGGPPIGDAIRASLGTELVENFVRRELSGSSRLCYPPEGATHTIEFLP